MHTQKSIVVLPFENISSDSENEYFADGITEEIINALSKVEGLKVTSRTSSFAYKNKAKDIRLIGRELGVSSALEGSIRKSGTRIRISAQLIRTDNGFQVWNESFDRDLTDIFELQDEISLLIADKIRENFGHLEIQEHLVLPQTQNFEAYSAFLKGRFYQLRWNVDDFDNAIEQYKESIRLDPEFYPPYFGLVQCYGLMAAWNFKDRHWALDKANHYLIEGLKINDHTAEAHFALATKALWVEWKPYLALQELEKALAINPNDSESLESAAEAYIALGRFEEATIQVKKALEVNPLSANHHFTLGNIHYLQEQYAEALLCFERSLQIDPNWDFSLQVSACCHVLMGNRKELDQLIKDHSSLTDIHLFASLYDAIHLNKKMDTDVGAESGDVYFSWRLWKLVYSGRPEEAIRHLQSCIANKEGQYLNFQREPFNKPLREMAAYESLIQTVFDNPPIPEEKHITDTIHLLVPEAEQPYYRDKLEQLMHEKELYMQENLSLRNLAEEMDLHANKLSWLINEVMGRNFNEYVNGYRVEAFKRKALEPAYLHYSLLGIAVECGFNSKSVFNHFFKKSEGMTPSAWLKMQKIENQ